MSELLIWWRCWWDSSLLCLVVIRFGSISAMVVYVSFIPVLFSPALYWLSLNNAGYPFIIRTLSFHWHRNETVYGCVAVTESFNFDRNNKLKSHLQRYCDAVLGIQINNFTRPIVNLFRILIEHPCMDGWIDDFTVPNRLQ